MGTQGIMGNRKFWQWVDTPEMHSDWFLSKQLNAYHGGTLASTCGSAVFVLLMSAILLVFGFSWAGGSAIIVFAVVSTIRHLRSTRFKSGKSGISLANELNWVHRYSVLGATSAVFAVIFTLIIPLAHTPAIVALIVVAILLMGSWSIDVIPKAALSFLTVMSVGTMVGLAMLGTTEGWAAAAIVGAFALVFVGHCMISFNSYAVRLLRARELAASADTVQLLLNDYEEHGADWLWEIGAEGQIASPSARFCDVSGRTAYSLEATRLVDLFDPGHDRSILEQFLQQQTAFRDIVARFSNGGEEHWWSLSGRPITAADGVVTGMRGVATDVSAAKRAEAKIAYMAHYDGLTDLPNRRLFNETLARALSRRRDALVAVLYLDLDHFKAVNDTLGHGIGDEVLKIAASRAEACVGHQDMVARLGGDEFAILLADAQSVDHVHAIAAALVESLSKPMFVERQDIEVGVSIGIALAPEHGKTPEALVKNADLALYHAKEQGRGQAAEFEIGMHDAMQAKRLIEIELRSALARDQLELHYQPLVNLQSGETTSYEALLRWNHPEQGMIMPATFIPIAEETGYIVQLGEWVIRTALMEVARWPAHLGVSVNLSPAQMRSTNLLPAIINALAASGVAPERLELEITESVLMHDTQANLAILHQLRDLGVRIALDDFGTGYSSLNYLRSFPFDKIKIDRCFVDEVDSRDDSRAIVRAVTGLAHNLGMVTTAEGVEREDQLEELRREGCTEVQGYLLSKPMPVSQIAGRDVPVVAVPAPVTSIATSQKAPSKPAGRRRAA
jgi:diguanylate cyclase (GGDEF)-like protein/PAS domain S-box-containing protein